MRDVTEAMDIYDSLTDEEKKNALACLRELKKEKKEGAA